MVTRPIVGKLYRIEKGGLTGTIWNTFPDHSLVTVLEVDPDRALCIDTDGFEQCVSFSELEETSLNPKSEYPTLSAENAKYLDVIRHKERGDTYLILTSGNVTLPKDTCSIGGEAVRVTALSPAISGVLKSSIAKSGYSKFEVLYNLREIHSSIDV